MSIFGKKLSSKAESLKSVKLFADLEDDQLEMLAQNADEVPMDSGTDLAKEGSHGEEFIFILDGTAKVEKSGEVLRELKAGDYFGEISLLDGGLRTASVTATSDVNLLVIQRRAFNNVLENIPQLSKSMLRALCEYVRSAEGSDSF
jgi:CRP-like cAMP-binding protein